MALERQGDAEAERELLAAAEELQEALAALRRAQSVWTGAKPWIGAKTWDLAQARQALEEAEARLVNARERLDRASRRLRSGPA